MAGSPWWLQLIGTLASMQREPDMRAAMFAQLGKRLLVLLIAAVIAIAGFVALMAAAYLYLATFIVPPLAALTVGLAVLALAALLASHALRGARRPSPSHALTPAPAEEAVRGADLYDLAAGVAREVVPLVAKYRLLIWAGTASAVAVGSWLARRTRGR